jgi:hypothetical protein
MQKTFRNAALTPGSGVDRHFEPAYSLCIYVPPIRHRVDVLLLSPDAGVWVGTQRNSSHPPGESGWVSLSSAFELGSRGRDRIFGIVRNKSTEETYDYRDRK